MKARTTSLARPAFTLIEILIVVVILGILSAVVIPQFSNATHQSRETMLQDVLRYLRTQTTVFKAQHRDVSPGYPNCDASAAPTPAAFVDQMVRYSDETGHTASAPSDVYRFGPYLSQMPNNPLSGLNGVWVVTGATMPAPDAAQPYGWIYNPQLQTLIANLPGTDAGGHPYSSY